MSGSRRNDIRNNRPDHKPGHRAEYERNRKKILATQTICGICGKPVDRSLKYPDPGSPTIDHIVPITRGGHPSALENLQLAHFRCNRLKFNQILNGNNQEKVDNAGSVLSGSSPERFGLPWTIDWSAYRYDSSVDKSNHEELWQQAEQTRKSGFMICIYGIKKNF